jgi:tetratricopeptide (TPR) repeat protein
VLYEPLQRRARVVYLAGGHQHPVGAADVDGDGRAELVFAGTANRQGWYAAVGIVPVRPWLDEPSSRTAGAAQAATPEEDRLGENALLWYALLPRGFIASDPALEVDPARRTLTVRYQHGGRATLSFDGFLVDEPPGTLAPAERRAVREAAHDSLRAAQRLQGGGYLDEALARTRLAALQAESAGDRRLREWAVRVRISVLIARGDVAEAEALAEELMSASEAAPEIAFDTARALHLRGAAEEAVRWYRRGLGPGSSRASGRRAWEFVEGAVLALAGLGRFAEAERVVELQLAAVPDELNLHRLDLEWCRLRRGATPQRERVPIVEAELASDFGFFALVELDLATGRPPAEALEAVERYQPKAEEEDFFVEWARAEALLRLGRAREARQALRRALERAERAAGATPSAVSVLPLLRLRLAEV